MWWLLDVVDCTCFKKLYLAMNFCRRGVFHALYAGRRFHKRPCHNCRRSFEVSTNGHTAWAGLGWLQPSVVQSRLGVQMFYYDNRVAARQQWICLGFTLRMNLPSTPVNMLHTITNVHPKGVALLKDNKNTHCVRSLGAKLGYLAWLSPVVVSLVQTFSRYIIRACNKKWGWFACTRAHHHNQSGWNAHKRELNTQLLLIP